MCRVQGHQVLAVNRGEREEVLKVIAWSWTAETALVGRCAGPWCPGAACMDFVRSAAEDAYDRLILPSMEREIRARPH